MELTVNGVECRLPPGTTLLELLHRHTGRTETEGVAMAVNGEIVHRPLWPDRVLTAGETVELITAFQGG